MYSSPCLNDDHDQCNSKACRCICHDKMCPECKGHGHIATLLQPPKLPVIRRLNDPTPELRGLKVCSKCNGYGRLRFQREDVMITSPEIKKDPEIPF